MNVLIVEDKDESRYMLESLLKGSGYEVVSAKNGVEALQLLKKGSIDMIISDILMPKMDGYQLCRKCKSDDTLRKIPFIFYTATYTDKKDEEFALSLGAEKFIVKPTDPDVFLKILKSVIEEYSKGLLVAPKKPVEEETVYLAMYNKRLIEKLKKKMLDLEKEITERKKAEEKIEKLAKFPSENPNPVFRISADGTILYSNEAASPLLKVWKCRQGQRLSGRWYQCVLDALRGGLSSCPECAEIQYDDRIFSLTFTPVVDAGYVNVYGLDITEHKKAEEKIEKLAKFPSENPYPVVRIAADGTVLYANQVSNTLLAERKSGAGQLCPSDWRGMVSDVLKSGSVKRIEVRHKGQTFAFRIVPVQDANYVNFYGTDITEQKKAEQDLKNLNKELQATVEKLTLANRELQRFAHIAAHDLKAPLRAIGTLADWISTDYADKFDEEGKREVELLVGRAARMSNMIDSILRYSEAGRVIKEKEKVNLNLLIEEVMAGIAPPENISVTVENELPVLEGEKIHFVQVFQNLLSNAVKYMDKPKGQIKVGCTEENGFWKFSVADNGPGVEKEYFEKIFEMFQTLLPRDEFEATGIGLSIVKKIVETYGGRVWVEPEVGKGSVFFFTLPKREMGG